MNEAPTANRHQPRPQMSLLSHLRWGAAALVALSHFRNNLLADYAPGGLAKSAFYFVTGYGHASVVVFFVLSGFLVGQKIRLLAVESEPDFRRYMVDRFARIFTVAWPALLLSAGILALTVTVRPDAAFVVAGGWSSANPLPLSNDLSLGRWLSSAALVNGILGPTPGVNGPLWSLAFEWTYYVVAGGAVALFRRRALWLVIYAAGLVALCLVFAPGVLLGGVIWLFGLLAGTVSERGWLRGRLTLFATGLAATGMLIAWRVLPIPDAVLGAGIALALAHNYWRTWSWANDFGERLASFSYTFYSTHYPLSILLMLPLSTRLPYSVAGVAYVLGGWLLACGFAWALSQVIEAKTGVIRSWLLRMVIPARPTPGCNNRIGES